MFGSPKECSLTCFENTGNVPPDLGKLTLMRSLNLSKNNLTGEVFRIYQM